MRLLISLLVWTSFLQDFVVGRAVFAHFMVSNTVGYTVANWQNEMRLAQEAHIDAFALNMARAEKTTTDQLGNAFQAANNQGFKLFFSFDYAGNGAWALNDVVALMTQYAANGAYYRRGSQPLASTFEGPGNAADWSTIKSKTGCFFIPDWSSKGAKDALKLGTADGLFNWGAWPEGPNDLYNTVDASYTYYLAQSKLTAYMMPASPWFYTNLPCFDKNWLWRGDSLWYDRWQAIWNEQPEFVQIISWNDFGESHYIGPLPPYESGYEAFSRGQAPFNYVKNMPHDGWRAFLPFLIDVYKSGTASVTREGVQAWYRLQPANACGNGGTTGNTGSQLQTEYNPAVILTDSIFFSALLTSSAEVSVTVGGAAIAASWTKKPSSGVGVYHGSVPFGSRTGAVVVKITRGGALIAQMNGASITTTCQNGLTNWNAWTGSAMSAASTSGSPPSLSSQVCVSGKGVGNLAGLCSYACERGYCPSTSCTCTQKGSTPIKPTYLVPTVYGCPLPSLDPQYEGLCSFACATGYCPPGACIKSSTKTTCTTTPAKDPPIPAASPTKPRPTTCPLSTEPGSGVICNLGTIPSGVDANFMGLCDFSCNHGFCPKPCVCTRSGTPAPATPDKTIGCPAPGYEFIVEYYDLCAYTCSRGYCPTGACVKSTTTCKSLSEPSTDKPWRDITCDNPLLTSVSTSTPRQRWDVALAQKAWLAAQTWFLELRNANPIIPVMGPDNPAFLPTYLYGPQGLQFSQIIADYFHAPENKHCQNVPDINCDTTVSCGQASTANAQVDSPAGQLIMNSFASIHQSIDQLQLSIKNAQTDAFGDAGTAVNMMTNFVDATKALIALDSIMLALSLVGAQFWGQGLKQLAGKSVAESSYKAVVQDSVTAFIAFGINVGKDLVSLTSELNAISNFQSLANGMCKVMQRTNANLSSTLFGGTPAGLTRLEYLVDQGTSYGVQASNGYNMELQIEAAIVATMLPTLWSANGEGGQFIMTTQDLDTGSGCDVKNPPKLDKLWLGFTDAMRFNGYSCIDGTGYWLLSASTQSCSTSSGICKGGIAALKGVERLTGVDEKGVPVFGGLTKEALIKSSLNAYKNNGNKNGWKSADPADHGVILSIIDLGVTAPGIFNAPICGADEALTNVRATRTGGKSANYPCN